MPPGVAGVVVRAVVRALRRWMRRCPRFYFGLEKILLDPKALRRCPAVYIRFIAGGRNWIDLRGPEGGVGKGWQTRKPSDAHRPRYKADLNSGEIWRLDRTGKPCQLMASHSMDKNNPSGYRQMSLSFPGSKQKTFLVHAILCWAAHGAMPDGCVSVDHTDGNPSNNAAYNLEWVSAKQQAANRRKAVSKPMLPFFQEPGEVLYRFLGSPELAYAGPSLEFTSLGRIVRGGKLSQATKVDSGGYPQISVKDLGTQQVHRLAWSAYYGPDAEVPGVIDHRDGDKKNFGKDNLRESNKSHNATAAHDAGAFDGTKRARQAVQVFADRTGRAEPWLYDGATPAVFDSQTAAAKALGAPQGHISQSIRKGHAFTADVAGVKTKVWACAAG